MLVSFADQIIKQLEQDYNNIADQFSHTRSYQWDEFKYLVDIINVMVGEIKLLDIGCGNGRLIAAIPAVDYTGLDLSRQLLDHAKKLHPLYHFDYGSMLKLPYPDQSFDVVAAVASLQHIPSDVYRQAALQEMTRVLKPSGVLFMLNWNIPESYPVAGAGYDPGDYLVPWKNGQGQVLAKRYYHKFTFTELAELCKHAGLRVIKNELGEGNRNIVTVCQ